MPFIRLLAILLIGLALSRAFPVWANVDPVATKKELQKIQSRIQDLQKEITRTQSRRSDTERALQKAEQAISNTRRKLSEVNTSMARSEAKLKELRKAQHELNKAKEAQRSALKQDINAAYRTGRQEYVKLLLNQVLDKE